MCLYVVILGHWKFRWLSSAESISFLPSILYSSLILFPHNSCRHKYAYHFGILPWQKLYWSCVLFENCPFLVEPMKEKVKYSFILGILEFINPLILALFILWDVKIIFPLFYFSLSFQCASFRKINLTLSSISVFLT